MTRFHLPKYLAKRGKIYYVRIPIPTSLRRLTGSTEIKRSLRTSLERNARTRCRYIADIFENFFEMVAAVPELTQTELLSLAQTYFRKQLVEGNDHIFLIEEIWNDTAEDRALWASHADNQAETLKALHQQGKATSLFSKAIDVLLRDKGHQSIGLESRSILESYAVRAAIESRRVLHSKLSRDYPVYETQDPLFRGIIDDTLTPLPGELLSQAQYMPTLEELVSKFKEARRKTWAYKSSLDFDRVLGWLLVHLGANTDVRTVTTAHVGGFRDLLLTIPKGYGKNKNEKGMTLTDALVKKAGQPTLSPQTAEKYLNMARTFLNWCVDEGYIDKVPGQKINIAYKVQEKPRLPFNQEQLTKLFSSPIWTGCYSESHRSRPGTHVFYNAYFWLPLVAAYTGMRCGEIVQLRHQDIHYADGIAYFDVNDDHQKKLKTKYSRRRIPVHPRLTEWGFLNLIKKDASPDERIFKQIKINKHGDPSHAYSKVFSRYMKDIGLKTIQLTFHSFRHTFSDALDNVSATEAQKKAMMGHSDQSASAQYGTGASIPILFEAMSRIAYAFEASFNAAPSKKLETVTCPST